MGEFMENKPSFEQSMDQLEEIVNKLESGNIPLEEMVSLYEQGAALGKQCMDLLDAYQARLDAIAPEKDGELHDNP